MDQDGSLEKYPGGLSTDDLCNTIRDSLNEMPFIFVIVSVPEYRYLFLNETALGMIGHLGIEDPSCAIGRHPWEFFDHWREVFFSPYEEARTSGEVRMLRDFQYPDAVETIYRDAIIIPNRNSAGEVTSISAIGFEVTERKQAEEALREAERKYRELVKHAPAAICEIDFRKNRYVSVNDAMCAMLGYSREELLAMDPFELTDEEGKARFQARISKWLGGEEPDRNVEYKVKTRDGRMLDVVMDATFTTDENGNPLGVTVIGHDITERKAMEETLRNQVRVLQKALLPDEPAIVPGYELASIYIPAFAEQGEEIGGDFYDVFRTEDCAVGILIGDVSGKGIEAAALAAATRSTIRAFAYHTSDPGETLSYANAVLSDPPIERGNFVTLFLAVLDPATGGLRYSSAGHPPPLLQRADGSVEELLFGDTPIGFIGKREYEAAESKLNPGDKLVIYTDGLTEARHCAQLFGIEGIERVLADHANEAPSSLIGLITTAATDFAQGRVTDDTAVIVIQRGE